MPEYDDIQIKDKKETLSTGMVREKKTGRGRPDLISHHAIRRRAIHLESGGNHHGDRNWEQGQPFSKCLSSLIRHAYDYIGGDRSEDHMAAVGFWADAVIHYESEIEAGRLPAELDDLPKPKIDDRPRFNGVPIQSEEKLSESEIVCDASSFVGLTYYLAGPMRNMEGNNYDTFHAATEALRNLGYDIISPAEMDQDLGFEPGSAFGRRELRAALRRDSEAISQVDGIVVLPGWDKSTGSIAEIAEINFLGLPIYEYVLECGDLRLIKVHLITSTEYIG